LPNLDRLFGSRGYFDFAEFFERQLLERFVGWIALGSLRSSRKGHCDEQCESKPRRIESDRESPRADGPGVRLV